MFKQNFWYASACDIQKHWKQNGSPKPIGKCNFKKFPENSGYCLGIHNYIPGTFFFFEKLVNWRTYLLHLHWRPERRTKPFHSLIFFCLECFHHGAEEELAQYLRILSWLPPAMLGIQISILSILNWLLYKMRSRNFMSVNCFPNNIFNSFKNFSGYSCMSLFTRQFFIDLGV